MFPFSSLILSIAGICSALLSQVFGNIDFAAGKFYCESSKIISGKKKNANMQTRNVNRYCYECPIEHFQQISTLIFILNLLDEKGWQR